MTVKKKDITIDLILPYVNSNDPIWQNTYKSYMHEIPNDNTIPMNVAVGDERFRDNGILKFCFRSIKKYIPWINKIHFIVQSESQIPKWLNTKKVNIVYHEDFIPKEYLPTFNSGMLDMFYHKIPGLNENFIYINDDMIFNKKFEKSDFFKNGKLVFGIKEREYREDWLWDKKRLNNQKLLSLPTDIIYEVQHSVLPHKVSWSKQAFDKYEEQIINSLSRFRMLKNYNQWLYSLYYFKYNRIINCPHDYFTGYISKYSYDKITDVNNNNNYKVICLNDSDRTTDELEKKFKKLFTKKFPNKCKYEL